MAVSPAEVEHLFTSVGDRFLLLLLLEDLKAVPKVKPGIPALAYRVLDKLTEAGGTLDEGLTNWTKERPRVSYHRLLLDRNDAKLMTTISACWLPQVRLVKRRTILFRSSVSIGDNGQFLAQDVGGKSFIRRVAPSPAGYVNLLDALSAEIDRFIIKT